MSAVPASPRAVRCADGGTGKRASPAGRFPLSRPHGPLPADPWESRATPQIWVKWLRLKNGAVGQQAKQARLGLRQAGAEKELERWTYALCANEKVEPTENWIKAHLWGGFAIFHWSCFGEFLRSGSEEQSRAWSGKRTVWRRRTKAPNRREQGRRMSLNRAMVIGYLGNDPDLRYLPSS
jgi:hypothetical protein